MADLHLFTATFRLLDDIEIDLEVDFDILTLERATEINAFWTGPEERVPGGGDDRDAVIRMAARVFLIAIVEASHRHDQMNEALYESEGWGDYSYNGIRMTSFLGGPLAYDLEEIEVEECG